MEFLAEQQEALVLGVQQLDREAQVAEPAGADCGLDLDFAEQQQDGLLETAISSLKIATSVNAWGSFATLATQSSH